MSEHHSVYEPDSACEPSCSKVRPCVQDLHCKEDQTQVTSAIPKRRKNQYATRASVRKPPPNASRENRAVSLATILLLSGAILPVISVDRLSISTAGERNRYSAATVRQSPE